MLRSKFLLMFQKDIKLLDNKGLIDGWKSIELRNLIEIVDNRGKTPPTVDYDTGFPLLEIGSIRTSGRIVSYDKVEKYVEQQTYNKWFRSGHPIENDILLSTVGSVAETKMFFGNIGCIAQNIVALRCIDKEISYYIFEFLNYYKNKLMSYEIGSVQASIKVSNVINLIVHIPPYNLLKEFNNMAITVSKQLYINEMEIQNLKKLKFQLLSKLTQQ